MRECCRNVPTTKSTRSAPRGRVRQAAGAVAAHDQVDGNASLCGVKRPHDFAVGQPVDLDGDRREAARARVRRFTINTRQQPAAVSRSRRNGDPPNRTRPPSSRRVPGSSTRRTVRAAALTAAPRRHRGHQVVDERRQQRPTLGRRRPRRVAEHPVRTDRGHALGPQRRQERRQRLGAPGLRSVERHQVGRQRQEQRRLGPAGVGIAAG